MVLIKLKRIPNKKKNNVEMNIIVIDFDLFIIFLKIKVNKRIVTATNYVADYDEEKSDKTENV